MRIEREIQRSIEKFYSPYPDLKNDLRIAVSVLAFGVILQEGIKIKQEDTDRFNIFTCFSFGDGDHFKIILKKQDDCYIYTDEAHTIMHLDNNIIPNMIQFIHTEGAEYKNGEVFIKVINNEFGKYLHKFIGIIITMIDSLCYCKIFKTSESNKFGYN